MIFDSIEKAVAYLKGAWNTLNTSGTTLTSRRNEIDTLITQARSANDQPTLQKLFQARSQAILLQQERDELLQKLGPFRSYFVSEGQLGVFPVWIVAGAGALASALYIFFEKVKNEGEALELIKKGLLSPAEAQGILGGGITSALGSVNNIAMIALAAYGLFLLAPFLAKKH